MKSMDSRLRTINDTMMDNSVYTSGLYRRRLHECFYKFRWKVDGSHSVHY